jgi:hypothetical protein
MTQLQPPTSGSLPNWCARVEATAGRPSRRAGDVSSHYGCRQPSTLLASSPPQDRDDRQIRAGAPVASAGSAPQKMPKPPPQPATPSGLLAPLAVHEPADPAGLGVAV